jgi:hypothetical protein
MTKGKTNRFVVSAKPAGKVVYHGDKDAENRFCYMSSDLIPEATIYIGIQKVDAEAETAEESNIEFHTHDVAQTYCLLDRTTMEVMLEDDKHVVSAPASVFIPAGMRHTTTRIYGKGYLIVVLQRPTYG